MSARISGLALVVLATLVPARAQQPDPDLVLRVEPPSLELAVGASAQLRAQVVDVGGRPVEAAQVVFFSRARRELRVDADGLVSARHHGEFEVIVRAVVAGRRGPSVTVPVVVVAPDPASIAWGEVADELYSGTVARLRAAVVDAAGNERDDLPVQIGSSDDTVAAIDAFGFVTAIAPGACEVTAEGGGLTARRVLRVIANPVAAIELTADAERVRTGDVVRFTARARGTDGRDLDGAPVTFTLAAMPDDDLGNGATGQIGPDGRFVAETPGYYSVMASCGAVSARKTIRADVRFTEPRRLEPVGHGAVHDVHTSDLWVWEGVDGRDYAVTGTWGANGDALFWDVTDPSQIERIASVRVDARTVNDVKVSADGRVCVISREGASNRKNGIVILDVTNPREPGVLSTFDDELTGGVHNVFIHQNHVYALSNAQRYDVIDIMDPAAPHRVGSFQLFEPGASIHDVWVHRGIAFSSNWRYGLRLVDVGNGIAGGSPAQPVEFAHYAYPSGWNHAAFPFTSPQTGKFYVVAGDEAFPYGLHLESRPTYARGWIHFVDFSDFENPDEVARYQVPEAGTHNLWIEGDVMYVAYYNGGLRVVDVSGDLLGDLYRQGREIAWFLPTHEEGVIANAPMTWGPQPHKGHIFLSDWNSGLWAVKLVSGERQRR